MWPMSRLDPSIRRWVVRKLKEKEQLLLQNLATHEKELALRQQAMEMHKRKAIESAQSAADLKLHLEKYHRLEFILSRPFIYFTQYSYF